MGETRVDLQHLLEDLRDAYTGALEETILTEVVANALDSGASRIAIRTSAADATLTIADNGRGMQRRELARYHDVAASAKSRGDGIGFAGVGIKLGLLVSREVVTETRRGGTHVATRWHLANRHRAPWKWIPPPGGVASRGTAVQLILTNQLSPLLDAGFVEETLRTHFEPLFDPAFDPLLRRHYPDGIAFEVDGQPLRRAAASGTEIAPVSVRLGRRRIPSAVGYLARYRAPVPEARQGVGVSTFGKVIRRGWDWLGLSPASGTYVSGLIEVPDLAACLTLSKNDFARTGPRGATYLAYRKAIQEVVSRQLAAWGDGNQGDTKPRTVRLERDLERVLEDLVDEFPLLRSLVDRRRGGQARLPMPGRGHERVPGTLFATISTSDNGEQVVPPAAAGSMDGVEDRPDDVAGARRPPTHPSDDPERPVDEPPPPEGEGPNGEAPGDEASRTAIGTVDSVRGRRRPARYGLLLQFESRPGDQELARLVDNTIWINDAHPAYARASASRSLGYHTALAVALALAPLAVGGRDEHAFITQFLAQWGDAHGRGRPRGRRRSPSRAGTGDLLAQGLGSK